jgi:hypothetical protein
MTKKFAILENFLDIPHLNLIQYLTVSQLSVAQWDLETPVTDTATTKRWVARNPPSFILLAQQIS